MLQEQEDLLRRAEGERICLMPRLRPVELESGCPKGKDPEVTVDGVPLGLLHRSSPRLLALFGRERNISSSCWARSGPPVLQSLSSLQS